ncbi:hypothetical protein LJC31_07905 [Synergistaceae bacterium OttesenSCG-928-I11]|nr:hypothetical protein [Synergistaceae bacterium OttesenSCG-928-I11]
MVSILQGLPVESIAGTSQTTERAIAVSSSRMPRVTGEERSEVLPQAKKGPKHKVDLTG